MFEIDVSNWDDDDSCRVLKAQISELSEWLAIELAIYPNLLKRDAVKRITYVPKLVGERDGN